LGLCNRSKQEHELEKLAETDFVSIIAQQMVRGIGQAVDYWLGRIERELETSGLTADEQLRAIKLVLREYGLATGKVDLVRAHA
jgi:hypothetical protein